MGIVTYVGPLNPCEVTLGDGSIAIVYPGTAVTLPDDICARLLITGPWLPGDQHTANLVPTNPPTLISVQVVAATPSVGDVLSRDVDGNFHLVGAGPAGYGLISNGSAGPASWAPVVQLGNAFTGTLLGGSGANASLVLGTPTVGQLLQLQVGTGGSPDTTLAPAGKIVRRMSLLSSAVTGDGSEQASAFTGVAIGDANNQVQTVGLLGQAQNLGTTKGSTDSPDACGIYGIGRIDSSGIGVGIGGFFNGMTNTANGLASGIQVQVYNNSGRTDSVNSTGFQSSAIVWGIAQGPNRSAAGFALGNPFGQQVDVGYHLNGQTGASRVDAGCGTTSGSATVTDSNVTATDRGRLVTGTNIPSNAIITSVTPGVSFTFATPTGATGTGTGIVSLTLAQVGPTVSADFRTDSNAFTGILVQGAHATAAVAVASGAGTTILGGTSKILTSTVLEVQGPNASTDPLAMFGNTTGNFYTVQIRNGSGSGRWFVAAGANNGLTGTIAGDTGMIATTVGKSFHIGGSASVIQVTQDNRLGVNSATPIAKPSVTGSRGGNAALASFLTAMASYGFVTDSTTA